jgi:hypothetical protein
MRLRHGYEPRPVRTLGVWVIEQWRLKAYGIAWERERPREELVEAARAWAARFLKENPTRLDHYAVGFIGVHDGRGENQVFLDRWVCENELLHDYVVSPADRPTELVPAPRDHNSVCVWDMAVQWFEREAWIDCVMKRPTQPDVGAYLARRLEGMV